MLDHILLGSSPTPAQIRIGQNDQHVPNPEYVLWLRRDQLLVSWLLASMSESVLGYVTRCTHAAEIWNVLESTFRSVSKARQMNLRLQLQTTKKGDATEDDYFLRMKGLAGSLYAAGLPIEDEELISYILNGFGSEYESIIVNLSSRSEDLSLQDVQYALQTHEMRLQQQQSASSVLMAAHLATSGMRHGRQSASCSNSRGASNGRGRGCGFMFQNRPPIIYQICGKNNHIASKCFKQFDREFGGIDLQAAQAHIVIQGQPTPVRGNVSVQNTGVNQNAQAMVASTSQQFAQQYVLADPNWYVDSGATNHVTADVNNLGHRAVYNGRGELMVGNGTQLPITHTGSGHSQNPFEGQA